MAQYDKNKTDAAPIDSLLQDGRLQRLIKTSKQQLDVQNVVREILPDSLVDHYTGCSLQGKTLILYADSATWATRLRGIISDLQYACERYSQIEEINKIKVMVRDKMQQYSPKPKPRPRPTKIPSTDAAQIVADVANRTDHDQLKSALARLAAHLQHRIDTSNK